MNCEIELETNMFCSTEQLFDGVSVAMEIEHEHIISEYFIMQCVAKFHKLNMNDWMAHNNSRKKEYCLPRQIAMYFMKSFTKKSLSGIGAFFDKNYATVIHACHTVSDLKDVSEKYGGKFHIELSKIRQMIECEQNI